MPTWEERAYAVVVALHPRGFRAKYGEEMKLMLNDMLKDPQIPRWRVWIALIDDIGNMLGGGVRLGVFFGSFVLLAVLAHYALGGAGHYAFPELTLLVIAFAYLAVGFVGARRSGFVRGCAAGVVAGMVSTLAFPIVAAFTGRTYWESEMFIGILIVSTAEGLSLVAIGAIAATFGDIQRRVRRSSVAFAKAWLTS